MPTHVKPSFRALQAPPWLAEQLELRSDDFVVIREQGSEFEILIDGVPTRAAAERLLELFREQEKAGTLRGFCKGLGADADEFYIDAEDPARSRAWAMWHEAHMLMASNDFQHMEIMARLVRPRDVRV